MSRLVVAAVALALGLLGSLFCNDAAFAERRVALVIGNSAYQHAPALRNPARMLGRRRNAPEGRV